MTEYGRGPGSEPWHPEDPLYGDGGWGGQEAQAARPPYGGQPQQHPEQAQQPQYGDWGQGPQAGYDQQGQQQYPQGQQQYGAHAPQQYDGQGGQGYDGQGGGYGQQYDQNGQPYQGGYDTGQQQYQPQQVPYAGDPNDPYGNQAAAYAGQQPDYYGTPDAYPPPEPPGRRRAEPEPEPRQEEREDWDPGPDQGEHAFFSGEDDPDDDSDDDPQSRRRGKGGKGSKGKGEKKRKSGCACLVVSLVFTSVIGGVAYFGYQFYENRFGSAPDYSGDGTSQQVTVVIPKGAFGSVIGQKLKAAGVVKSVDAFVAAQSQNSDGAKIQAGSYLLNKQMSAESAVALMLDPKSQNNLVVREGQRNVTVYEAIDKQLDLPKGSTAKVAKEKYESLGLPDWANDDSDIKDPLEGFLYPATYPADKDMKPEAVLKEMVSQANEQYAVYDLEAKAADLGLENPLEVVTVASLVQAEGITHDDFRKMAAVVYNRLKPTNDVTNQKLEFDSTYNYLKGQSEIDISVAEIRNYDDPYNTYFYKGLPPGPIGNPGEDALKAAVNPDGGAWMFFISIDGKKTDFTKTLADHEKLVQKFNERRKKD
ncbi:endolytic transglycosylase MltG [Streptomyces apricus]|uniref:Endolytic murein transglycosylase n=1 Tax=Streptomyces apricus TaxID=1828112 RepID=A0A5B0BHU5_9ACTN|nr:endolytic transglycosylase MltG [Streptomyces apricus]KAA0940842.1 endolytic transglycosylase MltG [Streptomyces apricus]